MKLEDFDYELPKELIAQEPCEQRDACRLMVLNREAGTIEHKHFHDIIDYLKPGDCLVMNDSKVIPARLFGVKDVTGAKIEFLLSKKIEGDKWETLVRPGKRLKPGDSVSFGEGRLKAEILDYGSEGTRIVEFHSEDPNSTVNDELYEIGKMPLPPYIERAAEDEDRDMYQTVYCKNEGSWRLLRQASTSQRNCWRKLRLRASSWHMSRSM